MYEDYELTFTIKDVEPIIFARLRTWFRLLYGKYNPHFHYRNSNFTAIIKCCPKHIAEDLYKVFKSKKFVEILEAE